LRLSLRPLQLRRSILSFQMRLWHQKNQNFHLNRLNRLDQTNPMILKSQKRQTLPVLQLRPLLQSLQSLRWFLMIQRSQKHP
jgi:hypothetical protein